MDDPVQVLKQVETALEHWSLKPLAIDVVSQSENIVYKVTAAEGTFAFRIHRPGYHTLDELNAEQEWTDALTRGGFRLPTTRPTASGARDLPVQVNGGTRYAGVIEWLNGSTMKDLADGEPTHEMRYQQLRVLGELMAKLHNHATTWQPSDTFIRHHLDVDGFFGASPFWGRYWESPAIQPDQRALLLKTQISIADRLHQLGQDGDDFGMIHADLHEGNVFISDAKMYLIDFDDAGFGWYLYDIAVALYQYHFENDYRLFESAFLEGYTHNRPLTDAHKNLLPMFLHIRSRALIGWATARPELEKQALIDHLIQKTCQEAFSYA